MLDCDVLIVGGGPAGSSCARSLRKAGFHTVVMDKQTFPRHKTCAGWITPPIVDTLDIDLSDYARGRVLQPIRAFRVSMLGRKAAEARFDQPVSYGIRRCEFDHYLLDRCGATMRLGEAFKSMRRDGDRWIINDAIRAPLIVGAGGHFCPVARELGASSSGKEQRVVAAQEAEFKMTAAQRDACPVRGERPELFFCEDLAGYAWVFRKGDYLNIGLGREDPRRISDHVRAFVKFLEGIGRIPRGIDEKFHGHAYILYGHTQRKLIDDGVLLIGDAAGLAYPQSGEGIRPAIESGLLAAKTVHMCGGDYGRASLQSYADALVDRFGKPASSDGLAGLIPASLKRGLASKLLSTAWFARTVVVQRWFLHQHQPPLSR
jgi:geranylgeranyl reductase family protein